MYPFNPFLSSTSFHVDIFPLYSTIIVPLAISLVVNKPFPAPFRVDRLTISCFSNNGMDNLIIFEEWTNIWKNIIHTSLNRSHPLSLLSLHPSPCMRDQPFRH